MTFLILATQRGQSQNLHFDSLRVYAKGQRGYKLLIIKNDKSVRLTEAMGDNLHQNKPSYKYHIMTDQQYQSFLDTLSKSLIFKLPRQREFTAIDESEIDITIYANRQIIISNGGTLSDIHQKLLNYLLKID